MKVFYFTSTGNSLHAARRIGGEPVSIPQAFKAGNLEFADDSIGLVFPVYFGGLPAIVERFLKESKLDAEYLFAVLTYGGGAMNSVKILEKTAAKNGVRFDYINAIEMIDNYVPLYNIEKEIAKGPGKDIEGRLDAIAKDIDAKKTGVSRQSGLGLRLAGGIVRSIPSMSVRPDRDKTFIIDESCNKCGICAKACPVGNIVVDDSVKHLHRCEWCLGCINLCPENAVHLKSEKSPTRFRNADVSLRDIIDANCQSDS
ncbi:MAG: EFR1 family ferrodoxin [Candidatus Methanoplasma sp.]|jgi:ferredoxin|nr:EFR1 family ferrodoxin [Candidatus Methanoplasma sp.]